MSSRLSATSADALRSAFRAAGALVIAVLLSTREAHASLFSPEVEDSIATFLAVFVIFLVPVVLIVGFWLVHILPEQIAHKRNHPQFEAIRTLCLLSLVFGGLLWPIAWLWAYSKPVLHKMAYGTDKLHPEEPAGAALTSEYGPGLHERLARLEAQGIPASELTAVRADLEALESKFVTHGAP